MKTITIRLTDEVQALLHAEYIRGGARHGDKQKIVNEAIRKLLTEKEG